jgi:DNA-binding MarR family transcriptional regulator
VLEAQAVEAMRGWQTDQDLFDDAAAEFAGLNRTDTRVIDIVQRAGRITAGQLAVEARLTTGAVTAVVDRLESAGLIRRIRDTEDRRRVLLEATPHVDELMAPVFGPLATEGYARITTYSDEEVEKILEFLQVTREVLRRHTDRVHGLIEARRTEAAEPKRSP